MSTYRKHSFNGFLWTISSCPTIQYVCLVYCIQWSMLEIITHTQQDYVCTICFLLWSSLWCLLLSIYLWIIKELQIFTGLCVTVPCVCRPPPPIQACTTWLTYTFPLMHSSIVFHYNGELRYSALGKPLYALVSFTWPMKSKALTHEAKYAWRFQYHLANVWIKCCGFHWKA